MTSLSSWAFIGQSTEEHSQVQTQNKVLAVNMRERLPLTCLARCVYLAHHAGLKTVRVFIGPLAHIMSHGMVCTDLALQELFFL